MRISDWPTNERPREKMLAQGAASLSHAELLAIFLGSGRNGQTAVDLGRDLLNLHGGLKPLLDGPSEMLVRHKGIGPAAACKLLAALELGRRYLGEELKREDVLNNPLACATYLSAKLSAYPYEVFACLFLDGHYRVIAFEELFRGTIDGANVYPREVVRRCLAHNAAAAIFAHNHPSGIMEPSQADCHITQQLKRALALIDVRVVDHYVIGNGKPTSMAQLGWM